MKEKGHKHEITNLRQKAEELLKKRQSKKSPFLADADNLKLIYELEVHQIELELQNEELMSANNETQIAVKEYKEIFDFTPASHFTLSKEGDIISINYSAALILGKAPDKLIKSRFALFLSDDTKPLFSTFLSKVFNSKIKQTCEVTVIKENKLALYVYIVGLAAFDGKTCHLNAIDITEKKSKEDELNRTLKNLATANSEIASRNAEIEKRAKELVITNKELEQSLNLNADKNLFISILAHDLKNPFGALLGLTELLFENISQNDLVEIKNISKIINQSAKNIFDLLEDMLKWSSIQLGKIPFEPKALIFTEITDEVITLLHNYAKSKNISITNSLSDELHVFADRNMLSAILRNLISNAIKFTNYDGLIEISATHSDSNLIISVSDNGVGIAPEILSKIFDISHFQSTTGTAKEEGTGLGLLICKEFVEKHGGKIWVESEVGKGSIFYFNMPFKVKKKQRLVDAGDNDEKVKKELKILIVDNEYSLRLILSEMTKIFSKEILFASSGEEALGICRKNQDIDIIFMDYRMSDMNGVEASREIRQFNKEVIIILQTAFEISDNSEEDRSAISDYYAKPYNKHALIQTINKYF